MPLNLVVPLLTKFARKEERKKIVEFDSRFLVMERGNLDCHYTDVLGLRSPCVQRLRKVFRVAARCSLSHLVVVLAAETCVGLTNAWILRKSNSLEDRSTRVGASFAMSFVAQVRRFRLITY